MPYIKYALVDSHMRYTIDAAGNLEQVLIKEKQAIQILASLNS